MGVNTQRTDGESIQVVAPVDVVGGSAAVINGFHGIIERDTEATKLVALAVNSAVYEIELAGGTSSPTIGDIVYIHGTTAGANIVLDKTASGGTKFGKIVEVDATNPLVVLVKHLENNA